MPPFSAGSPPPLRDEVVQQLEMPELLFAPSGKL
jgi:hypothetical protein